MQLTLQAVLSFVTALLSVVIAAYAWQYRETDGVTALVWFNVGIAIWAGGNGAQNTATTLEWMLFWVNVQYVGLSIVPIAIFAFATRFANFHRYGTSRKLIAISIPFVVLVLLSWTNQYHHLVRVSSEAVLVEGFFGEAWVLEREWGPVFWVAWAYSQLILVLATVLLLRGIIYAQEIYQRQTLAIVLGAMAPWIAHLTHIFGLHDMDPVIFFVISGGAFVYAALRYEVLDVVPVARDFVLEMLEDGVIVVNAKGRIVDVNDATTEILGRPSGEVIGREATALFEAYPELRRCYETGKCTEDLVIESSGRTRYYDVKLSGVRDAGESTVILLHDITLIRQREQELERQNEQLEIVAETLSHDLRNPINVASGFLEHGRQNGDEEAFDRVENAHQRMQDIIDDVLTLARQDEAADVSPVSFESVAREAWETVDTKAATLEVTDDVAIQAEYGQLLTLLENLYRNAVEHGGADVTVRAGPLADGFYIEDDGPGIPADRREAIFEHGFSGGGSTGFGLTIVSRVVDAHGWTIDADAGADGGARFEVTGVTILEEAERLE